MVAAVSIVAAVGVGGTGVQVGVGEAVSVAVADGVGLVLVLVSDGVDEGVGVAGRVETGVAADVGLGVDVHAATHMSAPMNVTNSPVNLFILNPQVAPMESGRLQSTLVRQIVKPKPD